MARKSMLEEFKDEVSQFIQGNVSQARTCEVAKSLDITFETGQDFSKQKRIVTRELLVHILREETDERDKYQNLLNETESWLNIPRISGYSCTNVGCTFHGRKHSEYVRHLVVEHFLDGSFICNFERKCLQRFSSLNQLQSHVASLHRKLEEGKEVQVHSRQQNPMGKSLLNISQPCKCNLTSCGGKQFPNVRLLMKHYGDDHDSEERKCIFENCSTIFHPHFVTRMHFYKSHTKKDLLELKEEFKVAVSPPTHEECFSPMDCDDQPEEDVENYEDAGHEDDDDDSIPRDDDEGSGHVVSIIKMLSNFLNELSFNLMVPQSTVQLIIKEYLTLSVEANKLMKRKVLNALHVEGVEPEIINKISSLLSKDDFIEAQQSLDTTHKRSKYLQDNFKLVLPKEVVLNKNEMEVYGAKKDSYQYIDLKESFKNLIEDGSFLKMMEEVSNEPANDPSVLTDIKDGSNYKNLKYFQDNPTAFAGILYSDAIEVVNPLGAGRGRSKLVQMYWTLADIPKKMRSKVDRIQLAIVVKEKILKKYGYATIYHPLIQDMKELEQVGIIVNKPFTRRVKVSFILHQGDNLEQHSLGMFSTCFSSGEVCRFCRILHKELSDKIHDCGTYWTEEEYDRIANMVDPVDENANQSDVDITNLHLHLFDEIEEPTNCVNVDVESPESDEDSDVEEGEDEDVEDNNETGGLRGRCPFNVLGSFHATYSLPLDVMHDYMEGIIAYDLQAILKILVSLKYFSEKRYNDQMKMLNYSDSDKPEEISVKSSISRLRGKALSILTHIRYFGLIVRNLRVDQAMLEEPAFKLGQLLMLITERLMSPVIRQYEVLELHDMITSYLDLRKSLFETFPSHMTKMKPKHHFSLHYGENILKFGPTTAYWTARYESKNRTAKLLAVASKNYINISKTVAVRQQFRQCSVYYRGMFSSLTALPLKVRTKFELVAENLPCLRDIIENMDGETIMCEEIEINGQKYKSEDVLILKVHNSDYLDVGLLVAILVKNGKVKFVLKRFRASRQHPYNIFQTINQGHETEILTRNLDEIVDYKPIKKTGVMSFYFVLHHHLSVDTTQIVDGQ